MEIKLFASVFAVVFIAELGDKTQLATALFAARSPAALLTVFIAASLALILASGIAVVAGNLLAQYVSARQLSYVAGAGFILVGIWTLLQAGAAQA